MLQDALTAFYLSPHLRSRRAWAMEEADGLWRFSLLGMLCALNGVDLVSLPMHLHNEECRDWLESRGFTPATVLALQEINDFTHDVEVLHIRLERYAETGERLPGTMMDDLSQIDEDRRTDVQED